MEYSDDETEAMAKRKAKTRCVRSKPPHGSAQSLRRTSNAAPHPASVPSGAGAGGRGGSRLGLSADRRGAGGSQRGGQQALLLHPLRDPSRHPSRHTRPRHPCNPLHLHTRCRGRPSSHLGLRPAHSTMRSRLGCQCLAEARDTALRCFRALQPTLLLYQRCRALRPVHRRVDRCPCGQDPVLAADTGPACFHAQGAGLPPHPRTGRRRGSSSSSSKNLRRVVHTHPMRCLLRAEGRHPSSRCLLGTRSGLVLHRPHHQGPRSRTFRAVIG